MFERNASIFGRFAKRWRALLAAALGLGLATTAGAAAPLGDPVHFPGTVFQGDGDVQAWDVAVAPNGDLIVAGSAAATDLPVTDASVYAGGGDAFVARFDSKVRTLRWLIYLGGAAADAASAVAVDEHGDVYVTGNTRSSDFPTTSAYDASANGDTDAFLAKLDGADGSHLWVTYLGGSDDENAVDLVVDSLDRAIVVGGTRSSNFPTVSAFDSFYYLSDAFIVRFAASGASLELSSYSSTALSESAVGVDVDGDNHIYVGISGGDFETLTHENHIFKIDGFSKTVTWSQTIDAGTGTGSVILNDVAVTAEGVVAFAGTAASDDPNLTIVAPWQATPGGDDDLFVGKLEIDGSAVEWSTFLGGSSYENSASIALTGDGKVWLSGTTSSADYPLREAYFAQGKGVVSLLAADGQELLFSTLIGGQWGVLGFDGIALASDAVPVLAGAAFELAELPITGLLPADPLSWSQKGLLLRLQPLPSGRFLPRRSFPLPDLERIPAPIEAPLDLDGDGRGEAYFELPDRSLDLAWGNVVLDRQGDGRDLLSVGIGTLDGARVLGGLDQDGDGEMELVVADPRLDSGTVVGWLLDTGDQDVDLVVVGRGGAGGALLADLDGDGEQEVVVAAPHLADGAAARLDLDQDTDLDVLLIGGLPRALLDFDGDGEKEVVAERGGTAGSVSFGSLELSSDGDHDVVFLAGSYAFARDLDGDGIPELFAADGAAAAGTISQVAPVIFVGGSPETIADLDGDEELELVAFDAAAAEGTFDPIDFLDGGDLDADAVFVGGTFRGLVDLDGDGEPELVVEDSGGSADTFAGSTGLEKAADLDFDLIAIRGTAVAAVDLDDDLELELVADSAAQSAGGILALDGAEISTDFDADVVFAGGEIAAFGDFDGDWELELVAENGAAAAGTFLTADGVEPSSDLDADVVFVAGTWRAVGDFDGDGEIEILSEDAGLGSAAAAAPGIEGDLDEDVIFVRDPLLGLPDLDADGEPEIVVADGGLSAPAVGTSSFIDGDSDADRVAVPPTANWRIADLDGDGENELILERTGAAAGSSTAVDTIEPSSDLDADVIFVGGLPQLVADLDGDAEKEILIEGAAAGATTSTSIDPLLDLDADLVFVGGTVRGVFDADGDYELEAVVENGSGGATSHFDTLDGLTDPDADVVFTGGRVRHFADIDWDGELEAIAEDSAAAPGSWDRYDTIDGLGDPDADVIYVAGRIQGDLDLDGDGEREIAVTDPDLAGGTVLDPGFDADPDPEAVLVGIDTATPTPSLLVTAPNGGGSVAIGNPLTISWAASGFAGTVRIELSRDGGATWETLFANTANDGSEVWTADGAATAGALVRITSRNLVVPASDDSDAVFSLI